MTNLAKGIKYVIEVDQNFTLSNFRDVIHRLARVIPDPGILVGKAGQYWGDNDAEVPR